MVPNWAKWLPGKHKFSKEFATTIAALFGFRDSLRLGMLHVLPAEGVGKGHAQTMPAGCDQAGRIPGAP